MARFGRDDYDQRSPFEDIPEHVPVFLIVGWDRAAPDAVRDYAMRASKAGASRELVLRCEQHARAMEDYQARHGSKVPDLGKPAGL